MGYSCSHAANECLKYILKSICLPLSQNTWKYNGEMYFFERGRENSDGAITGTVFRFLEDGVHVRKAGSVRIERNGAITRFSAIPTRLKLHAREKCCNGDFEFKGPLTRFV